MKTPAELVDHMFKNAKSIVESGREAVPMLALMAKDEITFVALPWRSPREKVYAIQFVRQLLASAKDIDAYAIVTEAWQSKITSEQDEFKSMPRDDPQREEILMVMGYSREGASAISVAVIKTDGKVRRVMQPVSDGYDQMAGQMVNFFQPEEAVN